MKLKLGKFSLYVAIIMVVTLILGISIASLTEEKYTKEINDYNVSKTFNIEFIKNIDINMIDGDIKIIESNTDKIHVSYIGKGYDVLNNVTMNIVDDQLIIKTPENKLRFIFFDFDESFHSNLEVQIPRNYSESLSVEGASTDIDFNSIDLDNFDIETVSGDLQIINSSIKTTNFDFVSGDILLNNVKFESFDLESVSGDLEAYNYTSKESLMTIISGDVSISFKELGNISVEMVSGDIDLVVDKNNSFKIIYESISGDFNSNLDLLSSHGSDVMYYKSTLNPEKTIKVETVSGDLSVY